MSKALNDNIRVEAGKHIDDRYHNIDNEPYVDVDEANSVIAIGRRYRGLTVQLSDGDEYWYKGGLDDSDLILKTTSGDGGGGDPLFDSISGGLDVDDDGNLGLGGPYIADVELNGQQIHGTLFSNHSFFNVQIGLADSVGHFYMGDDGLFEFQAADNIDFILNDLDKAVRVLGGGLVVSASPVERQTSALVHLSSESQAFLFNTVADISAILSPVEGMFVFSDEFRDFGGYINGEWIGITTPKIITTADSSYILSEADRNAFIIMTSNGAKTVQLPATGLSIGHAAFVLQDQDATGTIQFVSLSATPVKAFNDTIYAGGATVFQAALGIWHASGSLGAVVDSDDVYAAIDAAEEAAKDYADTLVVGLLDDRGNYNASVNTFPASGGSGTAGAVLKGDLWTISVSGTLGGSSVTAGDVVRALIDTPGQTAGNWAITENNFGYVAENSTNKSTSTSLGTSDTLYPTQNAVKVYVDAKVTDAITDGVTTIAPSQNAVFDALALKANLTDVIGVQDLFVPAAAMWPRTTAPCAAIAVTEIATSLVNIQSLDFDTTTVEYAQFIISLPRNWNNGTIIAKFYWTAASGSGTVQWALKAGAFSDDDALSTALGTEQTADDTLLTANDCHITPDTSAITIAGSPADNDLVVFQISRNTGSDNLGVDAKLLGVRLSITTDAAKAA